MLGFVVVILLIAGCIGLQAAHARGFLAARLTRSNTRRETARLAPNTPSEGATRAVSSFSGDLTGELTRR